MKNLRYKLSRSSPILMLIAASRRVQFSRYSRTSPKLNLKDRGHQRFKKGSSMKKNFSLSNLNRGLLWLRILEEEISTAVWKKVNHLRFFHQQINFLIWTTVERSLISCNSRLMRSSGNTKIHTFSTQMKESLVVLSTRMRSPIFLTTTSNMVWIVLKLQLCSFLCSQVTIPQSIAWPCLAGTTLGR